MREHSEQIKALNENMRKPKAWILTTSRRPYPIDKVYIQERIRFAYQILDKSKHHKYGSNSLFSLHMEIKLHEDSWYMHLHGVSGGITDLRMVRQLWGAQIKYEDAISPIDLGYYVSKYASKVPSFPNKRAYLEYASSTYKLQMHRFSARVPPILRESDWVLLDGSSRNRTPAFFELDIWLDKYLNDFGFGS
jgi:hypothetical protein